MPLSWARHRIPVGPCSGFPTHARARFAAPTPNALGVTYFGGAALPPPARPVHCCGCPKERVRGTHRPRGLQPPSRTPSPSAGGCDSPGISAYGRGKWEVERLYFNTPLWVGDLEKQLGEQECEVQPPPLQAWLLCR